MNWLQSLCRALVLLAPVAAGGVRAAPPEAVWPDAPCHAGRANACTESARREQALGHTAAACAFGWTACEGGDPDGCALVITLYAAGPTGIDWVTGASQYQASCAAGNARGCLAAGRILDYGLGVAPDPVAARVFYDKACAAHPWACIGLGWSLIGGDREAAKRGIVLLEKACDGGNGLGACRLVADAYDDGRAGDKDPASALRALERGCLALDGESCFELASRLATGDRAPAAPARAASLHQQACELGVPDSCVVRAEALTASDPVESTRLLALACAALSPHGCDVLAVHYRDGVGVAANPTYAVSLHTWACTAGEVTACFDLAAAKLLGTATPKDDAGAAVLLRTVCDAGQRQGCTALAAMLAIGRGVPAAPVEAVKLFESSCTGGDSEACRALGVMLAKGMGGPVDAARATALLTRACELSNNACVDLATLFLTGIGTTAPDPERGRTLLEHACAHGSAAACAVERKLNRSTEGVLFSRMTPMAVLVQELARRVDPDLAACTGTPGEGAACLRAFRLLDRVLQAQHQILFYRHLDQGLGKAPTDAQVGSDPLPFQISLEERALGALRRGCELRDAASCDALADNITNFGEHQHWRPGRPQDPVEGLRLYQLACDALAFPRSCVRLAGYHWATQGGREQALAYKARACALKPAICGELDFVK